MTLFQERLKIVPVQTGTCRISNVNSASLNNKHVLKNCSILYLGRQRRCMVYTRISTFFRGERNDKPLEIFISNVYRRFSLLFFFPALRSSGYDPGSFIPTEINLDRKEVETPKTLAGTPTTPALYER